MGLLQQLYIVVLNPLFRITGLLSDKVRGAILQILLLFFPAYFIALYALLLTHREIAVAWHLGNYTQKQLLCGVVLAFVILFSVDRPLKKVPWNPLVWGLITLCGIGILGTSLLHTVGSGYRVFGLMLVFEFPALCFVWNNRRDYEVFYDKVCYAGTFVGLCYYVFSCHLAWEGRLATQAFRYNALMENSNMFSMLGMVMFACALYLLWRKRRQWAIIVYAAIALAAGTAIMLWGQSRISIAACAVGTGCWFLYYLIHCREKQIVKDILIMLAIVAVATGGMLCLSSELTEHNEAVRDQRIIEAAEQNGRDVEAVKKAVAREADLKDRVLPQDGQSMDEYTSGRIRIWNGYKEKLNLWGNDFNSTDWEELTNNTVVHAHNNFLEMSYRCGVIVGGIFIVTELVCGLIAIAYLFRKKYDAEFYLFPVLFLVIYAFESMFDIATLPFERDAPFYFYLSILPMLEGRIKPGSEQ